MHHYSYTTIDPITRIEGHLGIEVAVDDDIVKEARASGTLFRGFELILAGRDPRDASRLTQRVCGVCPASHANASALALDAAFGLGDKIPDNAKIIRALILGSNFLQSHILHFYHLAALDYVDAKRGLGEIHPFTPRYEGDYRLPDETNQKALEHYLQALDIRRQTHQMLAVFGGKMPHNIGVITGGVSEKPREDKITNFLWRLNEIRQFIDNCYIPDIIAIGRTYPDFFGIGKGCQNLLAYGGFELPEGNFFQAGIITQNMLLKEFSPTNITEEVKHSWYADSSTGKNPAQGQTKPEPEKKQGYSFIKAPRYQGQVYELGPLARIMVGYAQGNEVIKKLVNPLLTGLNIKIDNLFSVIGRHAARALECKVVADAMAKWVGQLKPDEPVLAEYEIPQTANACGLTEAPRGSLGHWISIKDKKIERYQIITPTAWNGSPQDDQNQPGPIEQALLSTKIKDRENPFEIVRIVRSFDPCLACAVHLIDVRSKKCGEFQVV